MDSQLVNINTSRFQRISLQESEKAQLMQRVDSKFVIPFELSNDILTRASDLYYIVDNNGHVTPEYISDYFDTRAFNMYLCVS